VAIKILHCKGAKMEGNGGPLGILHCEDLVSSTKIHCKCRFSSTDIYLDVCRNFALQGYSFKSYDFSCSPRDLQCKALFANYLFTVHCIKDIPRTCYLRTHTHTVSLNNNIYTSILVCV